MEQQSDNNLDALFQKAAEEYPLKTNNKNWGIVAAKLHSSSTIVQAKKSKKWQYAILLLLLLGGSFFIVDSLNKKQVISHAVKQSSISAAHTTADIDTTLEVWQITLEQTLDAVETRPESALSR